ncbi:hypothetical protein V6N12_029239 [Hibiscus sabdariffa]|uniref:Uncharacterized protein n=1 Tax=Hibiscus sabdariffa TaxID=183260 RepID=A0ABR2CVH7_9ROSI
MHGIIPMKPCGVAYWAVSLFQIPLVIGFAAWILCLKEPITYQGSNKHEVNKFIFPLVALMARGLGGVFGIGGNSSYLFVHGVLLIHNVCFPILIVGHGADRHRARIFIHLFCRVAESNKGVRESIPNRVLDRYRDSSERHFDDYL